MSTNVVAIHYKLAYSPSMAAEKLQEAFLSPPLFQAIFDRFKGQKLPVGHFDKLLIREFGAPDVFASRLETYFIDGAKQCGLLNSEGVLGIPAQAEELVVEEDDSEEVISPEASQPSARPESDFGNASKASLPNSAAIDAKFRINVSGPGVNFSLEIRDVDDLEMIQVLIKKIEKAVKAQA